MAASLLARDARHLGDLGARPHTAAPSPSARRRASPSLRRRRASDPSGSCPRRRASCPRARWPQPTGVAVVVPSPATSECAPPPPHQLGAHVLRRDRRARSRATTTRVDHDRRPRLLQQHGARAGPSVSFTRIDQQGRRAGCGGARRRGKAVVWRSSSPPVRPRRAITVKSTPVPRAMARRPGGEQNADGAGAKSSAARADADRPMAAHRRRASERHRDPEMQPRLRSLIFGRDRSRKAAGSASARRRRSRREDRSPRGYQRHPRTTKTAAPTAAGTSARTRRSRSPGSAADGHPPSFTPGSGSRSRAPTARRRCGRNPAGCPRGCRPGSRQPRRAG